MIITKQFLHDNPNAIFVFGDNTARKGKGGAARLRDLPNTYGFITKKYPTNHDNSFYQPEEYEDVFKSEMAKLIKLIEISPNKTFYISKLGSGLANRYNIYSAVIMPVLKRLKRYKNVVMVQRIL